MDLGDMFYEAPGFLVRTLITGVLSYLGLIVLLLISGKRTLSKWNAFDFVVTIALGSVLATMILSRQTSIAQGMIALIVLIGLQFVITFLSVRWKWFEGMVKGRPTLLYYRGDFMTRALLSQRVTQKELRAAMRANGYAAVEDIYAVVLETDGSFSVIPNEPEAAATALQDIQGLPAELTLE